jgi:hypothetical protein
LYVVVEPAAATIATTPPHRTCSITTTRPAIAAPSYTPRRPSLRCLAPTLFLSPTLPRSPRLYSAPSASLLPRASSLRTHLLTHSPTHPLTHPPTLTHPHTHPPHCRSNHDCPVCRAHIPRSLHDDPTFDAIVQIGWCKLTIMLKALLVLALETKV